MKNIMLIVIILFALGDWALARPQAMDGARLINQLPDKTWAYIRLPHPWGLLSTAKNNGMQGALKHPRHDEQLGRLRRGVERYVEKSIPPAAVPVVELLLKHAASPLEAAVFRAKDAEMPQILLRLKTDFKTTRDMNDFLARLNTAMALQAKMDNSGFGSMLFGVMPVFFQYDKQGAELYAASGPGMTPPLFKTLLADRSRGKIAAISRLEQKVDKSGQGLFIWVETEKVKSMLPRNKMVKQWAGSLRTVALGLGVSDGKGRLQIHGEIKPSLRKAFYPAVKSSMNLTSRGTPNYVVALSLPGTSQMNFLSSHFMPGEAGKRQWRQWQQTWKKNTGVDVNRLAAAVGPELVVFSDELGTFAALRVRNAAAASNLIRNMARRLDWKYSRHKVAGRLIHQVATKGAMAKKNAGAPADLPGHLARFFVGGPMHYFWVQEKDYWIFSYLPQPLIDRNRGKKVSISRWLASRQKQPSNHALFLASARAEHVSRAAYYTYLQTLMMVDDMVDSKMDIFGFPAATQLRFPKEGSVGLQVDVGAKHMAATLLFEHSPMDALLTGSWAGAAATAGILAAVAVPAYQDYVKRAKVAQAYSLLMGSKFSVESFYVEHGRLPQAQDADQLSLKSSPATVNAGGEIKIGVIGHGFSGSYIRMQPQVQDGRLSWSCATNVAPKYLPSRIRMECNGR